MQNTDEPIEYVGGPVDGMQDTSLPGGQYVRFDRGFIYWRTDRRTAEGRTVFRHGAEWIACKAKGR